MVFELYDRVLIVDKKVSGEIIDITKGKNGKTYYCVESDTPGYSDDLSAYPGEWPQYECTAEELRKL